MQAHVATPNTWTITLAFARSRSPYLPHALFLARQGAEYAEEGDIIQASFTPNPQKFLTLYQLYEIVKGWKSLYIVINGAHVDTKQAGRIIWCYSERCRFGCLDYCYGYDTLTENPFGCHRLNLTTYSCPWWSYGDMDTAGVWHVDKKTVLRQLQRFTEAYHICPAFSLDSMRRGYDSLPDTIDPKQDKHWKYDGPDAIIPACKVPWRA